ncbi:hypothetical protein J0S23_18375 [Escherichia coli]|nr:hypothetical protein [Escherichia coli]
MDNGIDWFFNFLYVKKAADMLAEYGRRNGLLDTRLSELEKMAGQPLPFSTDR